MEFRKMVMITLYAKQQKRHRYIEQSFELCGRIASYVKQIASPGLKHGAGCSRLVHWDDPEGWDGEGVGRGVQNGEHMYTHG